MIKRSVKLEINLTVFSKLSKTRRHFRLNLSPQTRLPRISLEQKCLSLFDNRFLLLNINYVWPFFAAEHLTAKGRQNVSVLYDLLQVGGEIAKMSILFLQWDL